MRRSLQFGELEQVLAEVDSLLAKGYEKSGNWSLGQICWHMRSTMESNMNGYPNWMVILGFPLRPLLRFFGLPRLLAGKSPKGIPTAGMFVPANDVADAREVAEFRKCVKAFMSWQHSLHPHPGFGKMSAEQFATFHAAHAAHHLSFLHPKSGEK